MNACTECLLEPVTEDENQSCEDDCASSDGSSSNTTTTSDAYTFKTIAAVLVALVGAAVLV
jgi:hypothetical protein